jgi:hypothetical protein
VDDAFFVGKIEGFEELPEDLSGFGNGELASCFEDVLEFDAFDFFHDDKERRVRFFKVEYFDDMWVSEMGDDLGFISKSLGKLGLVDEFVMEHFDGERAIEVGVEAFVDDGHATSSEFFQ